jgi:hypothetical protein
MSRSLIVLSAACFCLVPCLEAQDQPKVIKGTVQAEIHKFKFSPEYVYVILVESAKSEMDVTLRDVPNQWVFHFTDNPNAIHKVERLCSPVKEREAEVCVAPGLNAPSGPQKYTLTLKPIKLEAKPILEVKGALTDKDNRPERGQIGQEHAIKLVKGKLYVAEMSVEPKNEIPFPSCSRDVGEERDYWGIVTSSSESGKPARCVIRPKFDGEYKVDASLALTRNLNGASCGYTLKVFQQAKE